MLLPGSAAPRCAPLDCCLAALCRSAAASLGLEVVDWAAMAETMPSTQHSVEADGFHPKLELARELFNLYLNMLHQHREQLAAGAAASTHRRSTAR
jgi:hypothetical protein